MATATEVFLVVENNQSPEIVAISDYLSKLDYMSKSQNKSLTLGDVPPCQILLFQVGKVLETNLKILKDLRSQIAFTPIIVISDETLNVAPAIAQLSNSILHMPTTEEILERKILRHLDLRDGNHVRVFGRADAQLKVIWRQEKRSSRESKTANISRGGAFIREGHFFPNRGDIVDVTIRGEKTVIACKAIVRWLYSPGSATNNTPGFGVEFLSLTPTGEQIFESLGLR
jgi:hypothetical protein